MTKRIMVIAGLLAAALALVLTGCINPIADYGKVTVIDDAGSTVTDDNGPKVTDDGGSPAPAYTVVFDKNAADAAGDMDSQTYTYGTARNLNANAYTRAGYTFTGWNTQAAGGGTVYAGGASVTNLTKAGATVTLYAQWEAAVKFTNVSQIAEYLGGQSGGASVDEPVLLALELELSESNWTNILKAIDAAGKFVSLDLEACIPSGSSDYSGLRSDGTFDPGFYFFGLLDSALNGRAKIVNLTLPALATGITANYQHSRFAGFAALKTVSGAGVTSIGNWSSTSGAFRDCDALTSVSFPAVTAIGDYAFWDCAALTSVSFPAATAIGERAFNRCEALTNVDFPAVTSIGDYAFQQCEALTSVDIPAATSIGYGAFSSCDALTSVGFPAATAIGESAFSSCDALTSVSFPAATAIGSSAFAYCPALTSVSFPAVTAISPSAFSFCDALISVTLGTTPTLVKRTSIYEIARYLNAQSGGASVDDPIPLAMAVELSSYNWDAILNAIRDAGKFISLDLAACTRSGSSSGGGLLSDGYFNPYSNSYGIVKIVNLTLPDLATIIVIYSTGDGAFYQFTALKTVRGAGVTSIGHKAFKDCVSLTSASFPAAAEIGYYAFWGCTALTSINFPQATFIGGDAFERCTALTSVSFPKAAEIAFNAFWGCTALTSISFPASAGVGNYAFLNSPNLRFTLSGTGSLSTLEDGKMLIRNNNELVAYPSASGAVTLPDSITTIGIAAFAYTALTGVTLGAMPPTLGLWILYDDDDSPARTVTVKIPASAKTAYGVPNLATTPFDNSSTADSWGRAFKGTGWDGTNYNPYHPDYGYGSIYTKITLVFETY